MSKASRRSLQATLSALRQPGTPARRLFLARGSLEPVLFVITASLAVHLAAQGRSLPGAHLALNGGARLGHILRETGHQLVRLAAFLWHIPVIGHWVIYVLAFVALSVLWLRGNRG